MEERGRVDVEVASERTNAALCAWCGCTVAAMETADVVLMDSNLTKMPLAISIGRATLFKIRENMMMDMVTKGLMLALTMANVSSLWLA
jgi:Cd2+/Zn2+-exporting ATPase